LLGQLGDVVLLPSICRGNSARHALYTLFLLTISIALVASSAATAADTKRIVLLHSFGRDFKPWGDYARAIRSELERQSPWPLEISDHSLMTARFSGDTAESTFVEYLRSIFATQRPELIISIGAPAAGFVQKNRQQVFGTTPMIFTAVEQRRIRFTELTPHDTVVAVAHDFPAVIETILRVLPDTKSVLVVNGNSPLEKFWLEEMRREFKPFENRLTFTWVNDLSFGDLLKQASALTPHSAIFWHLMSVDAAGIAHEGGTALSRLGEVANAPIFSYDDSFFGRDLVGGPMHSVAVGGRQTASVAMRILRGESPGDIKIPPTGFAQPKFDWRELRRWGISESRLPPGSEVYFREPTGWERYRWQIIGVFLALLLQSSIITWLLLERYGRRRAEAQSRTLSLQVMHLNRAAEAGALSASFAHDLGQPLVAIALHAQGVENLVNSMNGDQEELVKIKKSVRDIAHGTNQASQIIKRFRALLRRRSGEVQGADLTAVVADVMSILGTEAAKRQVVLSTQGHEGPVRVRADPVHLLQVLLNLATNAMDAMADVPTDARRVTVRSEVLDNSMVKVSVIDTGPGIPTDRIDEIFDTFYTTKDDGTGLGLSIARTIIETYGGRIWAENCGGGGAAFHFTLQASNGLLSPS
jgi:signal transduction histidine kinase/ABC-type uncharacterized transport system substrate-binding protein